MTNEQFAIFLNSLARQLENDYCEIRESLPEEMSTPNLLGHPSFPALNPLQYTINWLEEEAKRLKPSTGDHP